MIGMVMLKYEEAEVVGKNLQDLGILCFFSFTQYSGFGRPENPNVIV